MNAARTDAAAAPAVPGTVDVLVNFLAFQAGWFACVLGAARGWPWTGTALAAAAVILHLWRAARPAEELKLVAIAVVIGVAWDSLLINLDLVDFPTGTVVDGFAPQWILALWALFATTLNVSLRWLQDRLLVAVVLGAVAGPLSYWAGARLGALGLLDPVPALVALAIGWAVMTPLLLEMARHHDGVNAVE
jgi:Protein of unknown function (DUF2878)